MVNLIKDKTIAFRSIILLCMCTVTSIQALTITTVPKTNEDGTIQAYVPAVTSSHTTSVTILCVVYNGNNQFNTLWFIQRPSDSSLLSITLSNGVIISPQDLANDVIINGELINDNDSFGTNFTILNFTAQFDEAEVQCGTYSTRRKFKLGFGVIPSISKDTSISDQYSYNVTESHHWSITLYKTTDHSFPPVITWKWLYNGLSLLNYSANGSSCSYGSASIAVASDHNNYTISFCNITRTMSGLYTLVLTNSVGSSNKSFYLDVQFEPEVMSVAGSFSDPITVRIGEEAVLRSFSSDIQGNPMPVVTWIGPDGVPIINSLRYNVTIRGTITISNVTQADNGTYTCWIDNGIGNKYSQSINLLVLVPASVPQNVSLTDVTNTSCKLYFNPPIFPGIPQFSYYRVFLSSPSLSSIDVLTVPLSSKSLALTDLEPYTSYSISVTAVSVHEDMNWFEGKHSTRIILQTLAGIPIISNISVDTVNGSIHLAWIIRPQSDYINITTTCYKESNHHLMSGSYPSGHHYDHYVSGSSTDIRHKTLSGIVQIGPVEAMKKYACFVAITNDVGTKTRMIKGIESHYGLPSTPCIIKSVQTHVNISVVAKVDHPGSNTVHLLVRTMSDSHSHSFWYHNDTQQLKQVTFDILITKQQNGNNSLYVVMKSMNEYGFSMDNVTIIIKGKNYTQTMNEGIFMKETLLTTLEAILIPTIITFVVMLIIMIIIVTLIIMYYRRKVYHPNLSNEDHNTVYDRPIPLLPEVVAEDGPSQLKEEDIINMNGNMAYSEVHLYAVPTTS